jgi:hypothetical protein
MRFVLGLSNEVSVEDDSTIDSVTSNPIRALPVSVYFEYSNSLRIYINKETIIVIDTIINRKYLSISNSGCVS